MKSTLYNSLLSRLKNKHTKLATRFHKSVKDGEFQKQRYRKRKDAVERLKSLEKRIHGLSQETGFKVSLNYKHWAVALALGAIVATSNPVQAQEVDLSQPTILGNAYVTDLQTGDIDGDGDIDAIYLSYFDDPIVLRNQGGFNFTQTPLGNTNGIVQKTVLADIDLDGNLDLFMQNGDQTNGYTYQVWINDGAGNFSSQPATLPNPFQFRDGKVFIGDLDGDGNADLVVEQDETSDYVRTLMNDGSFNFSGGNSLPYNLGYSVLLGLLDVDGDTHLDIAFTGYNSGLNPLMTFINDGAGNFSIGNIAYGVYAGSGLRNNDIDTLDIDGDGDSDIIVETGFNPASLQVFLNDDGTGVSTFTPDFSFNINGNNNLTDIFPFNSSASNNSRIFVTTEEDSTFVLQRIDGVGLVEAAKFPGSALPADLDEDTDGDAFYFNDGEINTLDNQSGSYVQNTSIFSVSAVYDVDTVDIDNDGNLDIVTASEGLPSRVWLNDGLGNFSINQTLAGPAYEQAFGDLDQDGDMDMVRSTEGNYGANYPGIEIWRNDGGVLSPIDTIGFGSWEARDIELAFLDADGDLDIVAYTQRGCCQKYVRTFIGGTDLNFSEFDFYSISSYIAGIDTADVDGDTNVDVVLAYSSNRSVTTLINNGAGDLSYGSNFYNYSPVDFSDVDAFDIDGDTNIDVLVTTGRYAQIFLNDGVGNFTYSTQYDLSVDIYQSFHADIDQDGDEDIIFGGGEKDYGIKPKIYLNNGDGTFSFDSEIDAYADEYAKIRVADLDNDGDLDVIQGGYYSGLKVFFNQALAPVPDINIQGNGLDIASGDTTPDVGDGSDFGAVSLGETTSNDFTIENVGIIDLNISGITLGGANPGDFSITSSIPSTINAGSNATLTVEFDPITTGTKSAEVQITNDDPDEGTYTFSITGVGQVVPEIDIVGAGDIDILSGDVTPDETDGTDFGSVLAGSSDSQTFRIQNNGTSDLNLTSVALSGANAADFAITGITTPATIASGSELTFDLEFNPTAPGSSLATVTIESDDSDEGTYTFDVAGNAESPEINIQGNGVDIIAGDSDPTISKGTDFGTVIVGEASASTFDIQNTGDADLNINSIIISATNGSSDVSADFQVSGITTPAIVAAGANTEFTVTYTPSASDVVAGSILIANDDLDEFSYPFGITAIAQTAQEINVQGNALDIVSGDNTPDLSDGTSFGSITVGQQAISEFEIQNVGETDLVITDIQLTGADAGDFMLSAVGLPNTITAGNTVTISVTYTPSSFVTSNATIEITSDDSDEATYTFDISGSGKAAGILTQDSSALLAIYNTLGGTSWTNNDNWLVDGTRAETWFGVEIEGDRVTKLFLNNNNLSGTIPAEIGDLTALTDLHMSGNALSGAIPPEIGTTSLDTLILSGNQLSGSLPEELYDLTNLIRLSISQNNLTGTISPSIANLENLNYVALWENPFTGGTIPAEFWTMTTLESVFIGTTGLSGDISLFTNLTNLIDFWMDDSNFTGTISTDIGNLPNLELLDISDNQMTGTIPDELASLSNLTLIEIQNNGFTDLPDLSGLTNLTTLDVSGNTFEFDDLEPNASITGVIYAPQNNTNVPLEISINGTFPAPVANTTTRAENSIIVTALTGDATNNVYDWQLNGSSNTEQTTSTYEIPSLGRADIGTYALTVTNSSLPGLAFTSDPFDLFATAVISIDALDEDTENPINENVNAYLFPLSQIQIPDEDVPDTIRYDGVAGLRNVSSSFSFPEVLLGDYLIAVESVEPFRNPDGTQIEGAYLPTFFGDELLSINADTLFLQNEEDLTIDMEQFPEVEVGEGVVSGTIDEDFGDDESRIDARRRAKQRKCGLRRRRTGGRIGEDDDEFELIAYGETNENGEFEYGFLPTGTYRFFVEYPGIPLDESAFVEFEIGEAGVSDDTFVLAVFASPEGVTIEIVLGLTSDYFVDFSIYPNPTTDLLNIEYAEIKRDDVRMEIVNMEGRLMYTKHLSRNNRRIQYDTSILTPGQYFVRFIGGGNEEPLVYKIIKK